MKPDRVLSMLGIAAKAGSVASGEFSTEKAVKEGRAYLVIVAQDQVPMYEYSDKEMLGHFIGKEFRASLAVTNEGLSHSIEERLKQQSQLNNGRN